ncbi:tudor domain-containing protein 6 [Eublepharis macularius]|uniref:Tudor domain-containing protein 6 n=1 Tax=Eublepharis macularius TaxID=481883 RepID=A0AA97IW59_EUBMA|nr:tudor domain-containing protein 6 [Eublepharis macularius]
MCSVLPTPGTSITLRVSFVEVHPESPLARLWGLSGEWREVYARLSEEIQAAPGPRLAGAPGEAGGAGLSVGELCLVELGGRWLRCRVVGRPGRDYRVFLLDEGRTVGASAYYLARGREDFFHLPSEVLGCILADLVPPGNFGPEAAGEGAASGPLTFGWTAGAVEFLGYLHCKEVTGLVREVLIPQRLVVLELPWLLAQMYHLGLASQISPAAFRALLNTSLKGSCAPSEQPPPTTQVRVPATPAHAQPSPGSPDYFYPMLELNMKELVRVTQVIDPHRIYLQLRSLSKEICRLSDAMHQAFEGGRGEDLEEALLLPGSPCAAQDVDGRWYRALLLEVYPGDGQEEQLEAVAQVICVDYGRKTFVRKRNLRGLPAECFRMPVVTYRCSLQGITDGGCGWTRSQICKLKNLLLGKAVQAHIEAYCPFERVYYVTLFGEEGFNLNCLFGVQAHCLAQRLVHGPQGYASDLMAEQESVDAPAKKDSGAALESLSTVIAASLPRVLLKAGECHKAQVSFLRDPTHFCMYLQEYQQPLSHLKQNLQDFYSQSKKLEGILREPQPGSLCCVMLKENSYHRAIVTSIQGEGIEVYLVDRGDTEIVDLYKVKELLPLFRELPAVALRCSLANPSPSKQWSPGSIDYFRKAVLNKELVMQVLGLEMDMYLVELFDHSLVGEKNLARIMSQGKYAEHHEAAVSETTQKLKDKPLRRSSKDQTVNQNSLRVTAIKDEAELPPKPDHLAPSSTSALTAKPWAAGGIPSFPNEAVAKEASRSVPNTLPHLAQNYSEIHPGVFCEGKLEVGSTVDVIVSYVESPSLFWCQLAKTSNDLKELMADIQHHCAYAAQPHDWPNPVCLAKYSEDEKWYRALIVHADGPAEEVEVAYVDYGNKELVSPKNLRSTRAEFLQLKAQAFRCSLYNLIEPNNKDPFVWDEKATDAFQEFIDSASKIELKCTIFALAVLKTTYLLNVVDLITPFESACHYLTRKGFARPIEPQKPLTPSVYLFSYYYSTHDIKIGSEELVYVTHIKNLQLFYCQLARSASALEHLTDSIGKLSKTWHSLKSSPVPGNLYLAKYTDGYWYRAILAKARPTKEVFFVDFGNTEVMKDEDLILVPRDAYEILCLPMQAIKCSLSDIADAPKQAISWFENAVLDKPLKALIVAKDSDGKLIVELYGDKMQINAKLKERFNLKRRKDSVISAENQESSSEARRPLFRGFDRSAPESKTFASKNLEPLDSIKSSEMCGEAKSLQQKPTRSSLPVERQNQSDSVAGKSKPWVPLQKREQKPDSLTSRNPKETCINLSLKKMCDLPLKNVSPGSKALVYVSHVNNPSDFYVQLVEDELLLDGISEKLNQSETVENLHRQQLHVGDLMCAVFSEDGFWYRAVVQKEPSADLVSVQYIDYGNTAEVNICKTRRLPEDLLLFPAMTIHCSSGGGKTTELPEWTEEAVLSFSQSTKEIQMNCEFVEQVEGKWEVALGDREDNEAADLVNSQLTCQNSLLMEASDKNETEVDLINLEDILPGKPSKPSSIQDAKSFFWKIPVVGQTVKTFARDTNTPGYFWCQFADLDDCSSIEKKVQDACKLAGCHVADIKIGCCCLAKGGKDESFYRAVVTSVQENTLRVAHIDYGTEELVTGAVLRQISDELLTLPPQAFPCCLFGFNSSEGSWVEGINDIFYKKIVDSLLDVTIMEILCNGPFEIPLFVVNVECQGRSINEQMKAFWKPSTEGSGLTVSNILSLKGQNKDAEAEDSAVVLCAGGMSPRASMASDDTWTSADLCTSEPFQPIEKCSASAGNMGLSETEGNECPSRHHQATFEVFDVEEQQTVSETPNNELDSSVPEMESDSKTCVLQCTDVPEMQLPAIIETEILGQNPFIAPEEVRGPQATLTQDPFEAELPSSGEEDSSDLVPLEVPLPFDNKQLLTELEALGMHTSESLLELESVDVNGLSCDEMRGASKLGSDAVNWVESEWEQSPLVMDEVGRLLSCGPERLTPATPLWQGAERKEPPALPAAPPPAVPESLASLLENELKPRTTFHMGEAAGLREIGLVAPNQDDLNQRDVLEKSFEQAETRPVVCRGFEGAAGDSASRLRAGEQAGASCQRAEKNKTTCELKGFDVGPKCMVRTETRWYEAQTLGVSAEGTKEAFIGDLSISTELFSVPKSKRGSSKE